MKKTIEVAKQIDEDIKTLEVLLSAFSMLDERMKNITSMIDSESNRIKIAQKSAAAKTEKDISFKTGSLLVELSKISEYNKEISTGIKEIKNSVNDLVTKVDLANLEKKIFENLLVNSQHSYRFMELDEKLNIIYQSINGNERNLEDEYSKIKKSETFIFDGKMYVLQMCQGQKEIPILFDPNTGKRVKNQKGLAKSYLEARGFNVPSDDSFNTHATLGMLYKVICGLELNENEKKLKV